jgi:hypothetical protein
VVLLKIKIKNNLIKLQIPAILISLFLFTLVAMARGNAADCISNINKKNFREWSVGLNGEADSFKQFKKIIGLSPCRIKSK